MTQRSRITRPAQMIHGGGGADAPADREIRYKPYNADRENKN